jgi:subtilisin-like proprotein convertase family protein
VIAGANNRRLTLASLALALILLVAAAPATAAKKKKGPGTFTATKAVNLPVPDAGPGPTGANGLLTSTITAGKPFKGRQIRDVDVTVQTTGIGMDSVSDLDVRLTAPNGATVFLVGLLFPGNALGPLTLDDDTNVTLGSMFGPFQLRDPRDLYAPWAGTAQPQGYQLAYMDGGPVRGNWMLSVSDLNNTDTNTLVSWGLKVVAGRPFRTK